MASQSNQAAFLDKIGAPLRVGPTDLPIPDADEIVIKNHAVAINPVDWYMQDTGMFVRKWPVVLGTDIAGEVHEVGANVTSGKLRKGDRVIAHTANITQQETKHGGFALYTAVPAATTARIPDSMAFTEGAVLPLALDTALVGLCMSAAEGKGLGLPFPSLEPKPSGKTIVVWGGSSSVGALAIQLAAASGTTVIAVASTHNHNFCKAAGASSTFDYKSPTIVADVVAAIKASGGEFAGVYDAISKPDASYKHTFPILEQAGGSILVNVLPGPEGGKGVPKGVRLTDVFGCDPAFVREAWEGYVTPALEGGKLRAIPEALVVGKGLESVQKGLDTNKKGVSARKVVVEL